eukprot:scaffold23925_cov157-Cylindrotheca_fusiformis.AAC.3
MVRRRERRVGGGGGSGGEPNPNSRAAKKAINVKPRNHHSLSWQRNMIASSGSCQCVRTFVVSLPIQESAPLAISQRYSPPPCRYTSSSVPLLNPMRHFLS